MRSDMSMVMPNDLDMDEMIAAMKRLLKVSARMYMHLTRSTIERFGREGEMTVRYGLRAYGHWRGTEMRQAHHAMGLDLDMKNLIGCWDNASTYIVKDEMSDNGIYKPHDTSFDVPYCPAAEAWKDADFHRWGHVYCDEFHQACASAYHPDGNVVIPINLMKGDDHCHFRWVMPPDAEAPDLGQPTALGQRLAQDYVAQSDIEAAWKSLKRSNRLVGGRFYSHASIILDRHGEDGHLAIADAMKTWGAERGMLLREEHRRSGREPSVANFIRFHDMPLQMVWRHEVKHSRDGGAVIEILETPHDEAWKDARASDLGDLWYRHAYPAMAGAYMPGLSAEWTRKEAGANPVNSLKLSFG